MTSPQPRTRIPQVQRRTLTVLATAQTVSGIGMTMSLALSALIVYGLSGSEAVSGLAGSITVLGTALMALPIARATDRGGRRPGLVTAYGFAVVGCAIAVVAIAWHWWPLLLAGLFLVGAAGAGNLSARYSATDLAPPGHAARHLSLIVWAATIGSVTGPNLTEPAHHLGAYLGLPGYSGVYVLAAVSFLIATVIINLGLRPDPLLLARAALQTPDADHPAHSTSTTPAARATSADPAALTSHAALTTSADPASHAALTTSADPAALATSAGPAAPATGTSHAAPATGTGQVRVTTASAVRGLPARSMRETLREAAATIRASPMARRALLAIAVSHAAMVSIMSMTPVHLDHNHQSVTVIGMVISLHIAGMTVLAPVVGWAADRLGRIPVLVTGLLTLVIASGLAASAATSVPQITVALILLGVGWSCGLIAGSALLTESTPLAQRPAVQGLSDLFMNISGAAGALLAGAVVGVWSYAILGTAITAMVAVTALSFLTRPPRQNQKP